MRIAQSLCAYVIAFAICSLSTFSMFAQLPSYLPVDGLVAWYPFNGNANDESGNGNNGVVNGSIPFILDRSGRESSAIQGGAGYLSVGTGFFNFSYSSSFSLSVWFTQSQGGSGRLISTENPEGQFRIATYGGGINAIQFGNSFNYIYDTINDLGWHNYTFVYSSGIAKKYVDGVLESTASLNYQEALTYGYPFTIGAKAAPAYDKWNGKIDDIGIWNRALTQEEVVSIFDSQETLIFTCAITASSSIICSGETVELSVNDGGVNSSACSSNQLPTNLQNGLVAYYPFCGNANDASGNGNNGVVNGALLTNDRFGNTNAAYQFNNNFIRIPYNSLLSPTSATVSTWLKVNGLFGQDQELLFAQSGGRPSTYVNSSYRCGQLRSAGNSWRTTSSGGTSDFATVCSETILDDGQWHHVVGTYTPTSLKIYVDGVLEASTSTSLVQNQNIFEDYYIGGFGPSAGGYQFFKGTLDDLFIYNRVLNETEIAQLFASSQISWSTGATSPSISVTPAETTTYSVTVNQGGQSCTSEIIVTVNQASAAAIEGSITEGETYEFNGQSLAAAGTYEAVLVNAVGCDSVVTLTLTVNPALTCEISASATSICAGESVELSVDAGAAITSACASNQLPANLQNGLVAYYPFCGNANDASGNGNNGVVNGAVLATNRLGVPNSAYYFNGNSSNIRVSHSASLTFTDNITVSLWLNAPNYSLNNNQVRNAIGKRRTSSLSGWGIETVDDFQTCCGAQFFINNNTASGGLDYEDPAPMPINQWVHLVGIYDGQLLSLYQNGQLLGTATGMQNLSSTLQDMFIGSEYLNGSYFLGAIDDIFIWNRAISPDEVQTLYSANEAANVLWSTGATTPSITVAPTETITYSVTVTQDGQTCTSDVTITVNQPSVAAIEASITEGETYDFNGQSLTSAGTYESVLVNAAGCDSVVTLTLTVNPAVTCEVTASATSICAGESVELSVDGGAANATACTSNQLPANLQNGLVAYYPFCGNANDASGNGNDGVVNGASLITDRFGSQSAAYRFNGTTDYISGSCSQFPTNSRTISYWFKSNLIDDQSWFFGYGGGNCGSSCVLYANSNQCSVTSLTSINYSGHCCNRSFNVPINSNGEVWHHLAITSSTDSKVYLDGEVIYSGLSLADAFTVSRVFYLGAATDPSGTSIWGYYNGDLDDIFIYNRALTASEIQQLFASQSYTWSTGATTPSITVAPTETTTYSVTVTQDGLTCTSDVTILVNQSSAAAIEASITEGETYDFNGQSLAVAGTYEAVLENAAGCDSVVTLTLSVEQVVNPLECSITNSANSICLGESIELTVSHNGSISNNGLIYSDTKGFNGPWQIDWPVNPGENYILKVTGEYDITVSPGANFDAAFVLDDLSPYNQACEGYQDKWKLSENCPARPNPDVYNPSHIYFYEINNSDGIISFSYSDCCFGDNSGSMTFELFGNSISTDVLWSTGETTPSITVTPTETTTYTVTVTQGDQTCTSDVTIEVLPTETFYADNDGDGFGDAGNSINACEGQPQGYVTDNTDCDDTSAAVYIGASCDDGDACTEGDILRGDCTCAGTYADDDQDGTCNALDLCAFGPEPGTACDDNNPCTYNDSIQDDCTCVGQPSESETSLESAHACEPYEWNGQLYTQSGTYTYATTNALGCDSIATLELTVGAPSSSSTTINACNGYTWNEQAYTQSGTYTFVTPNTSGCDSTAILVLTIQNPSVAPTAINASSASVTVGGSVTLSVVGGTLGSGAQWKWYSQSCGGQFIGTGNSITVTVNATTTYFVRAEGDCNVTSCASVTITANPIPCGPQSVAASALSVCYGSSTMLTVSGQLNTGATWKWYKNGCGSGVVVGTGSSLAVLPTATTTYFVRAEGGTCGITSCQSITITVNPAPAQPAFIQGPVNGLCGLQGVSYSTPAVSGASSYVWSVPTGATIVSGQGTNAIVVNYGSSLGINTVCGATAICVRSVNACGSSALRCVNLSVAPATPGAITGQSIVCRTQSYTYSIAPVAGATSYTWTVPSTWQITSGQGTNSITVVAGTMNGEVRVFANNACGASKIARRSVTTFVCSNPGMTMLDEMPELALWPNPAQEIVHLDVDQIIPDKVEIYDMLGKRMYEGAWTNEFDVTLWPSGMYIVRVTLGEEHLIQRLEIAH